MTLGAELVRINVAYTLFVDSITDRINCFGTISVQKALRKRQTLLLRQALIARKNEMLVIVEESVSTGIAIVCIPYVQSYANKYAQVNS